jgi:hypothetical protein
MVMAKNGLLPRLMHCRSKIIFCYLCTLYCHGWWKVYCVALILFEELFCFVSPGDIVIFYFCLQRSVNAFFEATEEGGASVLTDGDEQELVVNAKWVNKCYHTEYMVAHGNIDGWGAMLQARRSWVWVPMWSWNFVNWLNPSGCSMALGFTQPLKEMTTRRYFLGISWPAHTADNLTIICELTV